MPMTTPRSFRSRKRLGRASGAVLADIASVGKLLKQTDVDQSVDGVDDGRSRETDGGHRIAGSKGFATPSEVKNPTEAGATGP